MSGTLSDARALLLSQSKEDAFENVYNSLDLEGLICPSETTELCKWCGNGWKSLIYGYWCSAADGKGLNPKDLRHWGGLLALYDGLKREHERGCQKVPRWKQ